MKDKYTNNEINLNLEHYMIHDAKVYQSGHYFTVTAASSQDLMIICGAVDTHMVLEAAVSGQALISFYEGVTINAGAGNTGVACSIFNMNRNSTDSCLALCFRSQSTTSSLIAWSAGAAANYHVLYQDQLPGGDKVVSMVGSSVNRTSEWVLKDSQKYLLRVTNQAASTITASLNFRFYELDL